MSDRLHRRRSRISRYNAVAKSRPSVHAGSHDSCAVVSPGTSERREERERKGKGKAEGRREAEEGRERAKPLYLGWLVRYHDLTNAAAETRAPGTRSLRDGAERVAASPTHSKVKMLLRGGAGETSATPVLGRRILRGWA